MEGDSGDHRGRARRWRVSAARCPRHSEPRSRQRLQTAPARIQKIWCSIPTRARWPSARCRRPGLPEAGNTTSSPPSASSCRYSLCAGLQQEQARSFLVGEHAALKRLAPTLVSQNVSTSSATCIAPDGDDLYGGLSGRFAAVKRQRAEIGKTLTPSPAARRGRGEHPRDAEPAADPLGDDSAHERQRPDAALECRRATMTRAARRSSQDGGAGEAELRRESMDVSGSPMSPPRDRVRYRAIA